MPHWVRPGRRGGGPTDGRVRVIYAFDGCELDLDRYELRCDGSRRPVEPQVFDVLALLVRERARVVPKGELLDAVWGDRFVSDSALTSRIKAARRAVGDDGRTQRLIRTVHGRGYQFVGATEVRPGDGTAVVPGAGRPVAPPQEIRFCTTSDDVRLAYATSGSGPPLVKWPTGSATSTTTGRARCGVTGSSSCRAGSRWSATTSGAAGCPTGTSPASPSTTGWTTWRP